MLRKVRSRGWREKGNSDALHLAISLVCAIGMPEAFATPAISSGAALVGKADLVNPVKHKIQPTRRKLPESLTSAASGKSIRWSEAETTEMVAYVPQARA